MRTIFHVDMDAFFASIEIVRNPSLKGKPVIVGGRPDSRGVVSTCSYEARKYGIRSAMSLKEAYKKCPNGIFLDGNYSLYSECSDQIMEIFRDLTPILQIVSIDEAYLDVSEVLYVHGGNGIDLANDLKKEVYDKTKLPCSIGIAPNKLLAKIASGLAKPNGVKEVPQGSEASFLAPLPIQAIPGIGEKTREFLNSQGILYISDLQSLGLDALMQRYGERGYYFYFAACGKDNSPVVWIEEPPKSIGAETTFETDQTDTTLLIEALKTLNNRVWKRLKLNKMHTRSVTLKMKDSHFRTVTRAKTLLSDTDKIEVIQEELLQLFEEHAASMLPIRLIGVSLHKLTDEYWQPTFWDLS